MGKGTEREGGIVVCGVGFAGDGGLNLGGKWCAFRVGARLGLVGWCGVGTKSVGSLGSWDVSQEDECEVGGRRA